MRNRRFAWRVSGATALFILAALAACQDSAGTAPLADEWAQGIAASVQVSADIQYLKDGKKTQVHHATARQPVRIFGPRVSLRGDATHEPRTTVRHSRQRDGTVHSIGLHYPRGAKLPAFVYLFENGRIRTIVGLSYGRHGMGYYRRHSRVTTFDSLGQPTAQASLAADRVALGSPARVQHALGVVADAAKVLLPRELHAAEEEGGPCNSEYVSYAIASASLALATTLLEAALYTCATAKVPQLTCVAAIPLSSAWLSALDKWNQALDKLIACTNKAREETSSGRGGTFDDFNDEQEEDPELRRTVEEFIDDALESGNYKCTSDGTTCTYYAAE